MTVCVALAVVVVVIAVARLGLDAWTFPAVAAVLLAGAWSELGRAHDGGPAPWPVVARSARDGLLAAAIFLPPFLLAAWLVARARGFSFEWGARAGWIDRAAAMAVMACAEEAFFRAWLLERLDQHRSRRGRGVPSGVNIAIASAAFAAAHLGTQGSAGLLVFFPGLVFGWLWSRRRSLAGPVVFHVLCNVLVQAVYAIVDRSDPLHPVSYGPFGVFPF